MICVKETKEDENLKQLQKRQGNVASSKCHYFPRWKKM